MAISYEVPRAWGEDPLAEFIETARQNTVATFANLGPEYNRLRDIHLLYLKLIDNLHNSPDWFSGFFVLRAHASYLGAVRLALSGQAPETYMLLRGCLENALYGLYCQGNPTRQEVWLRRHEDEASMRRVKAEFTVGATLKCLKAVDDKTHARAKKLYDRTIDYGGHPNEKSIMSNLSQRRDQDSRTFLLNYLASGSTLPAQAALKSTAQVGVCSLAIFRNVFRERFDILSLDDRLRQLSASL